MTRCIQRFRWDASKRSVERCNLCDSLHSPFEKIKCASTHSFAFIVFIDIQCCIWHRRYENCSSRSSFSAFPFSIPVIHLVPLMHSTLQHFCTWKSQRNNSDETTASACKRKRKKRCCLAISVVCARVRIHCINFAKVSINDTLFFTILCVDAKNPLPDVRWYQWSLVC